MEFALSLGCERLATGHYARIEDNLIKVAVDTSKDQSYFLANVDPNALKFMLFPLGTSLKSEIKNDLREALRQDFDDFKSQFLAASTTLFGSGWCWLVYDLNDSKLKIMQTQNAATPITENKVPLLVVDVWEHAYYIDFKNARANYLDKFFENINWRFVSEAISIARERMSCSSRT